MTPEQDALIKEAMARWQSAAGPQPAPQQSAPVDPVQLGQQAIARWNGGALSTPDTTWAGNGPGDLEEAAPVAAPPAAMMGAQPAPVPQAPAEGPAAPVDASMPAGAPGAPPAPPQRPAGPRTFDGAVQDYAQSSQEQADAVRAEGEAKAQGLEQQAALERTQAEQVAEEQKRQAEERKAHEAALKESTEQFAASADEASKMRAVDKRGTGQRIAGMLGVALAGIGDAFAKMGGNASTQYAQNVEAGINAGVERDLQLQREAIDDKRKSAAAKLTEVGLAQKMLDNVDDQNKYALALLQLKHAGEVKAQASQFGSQQARAVSEAGASKVEADADKTILDLTEKNAAQKMRSRFGAAKSGGGVVAGQQLGTQKELEAKVAAGVTLSKAEAALLKQQQGITSTSNKATEAQLKADAKNADRQDDIIPGYHQDDATVKLTPGEVFAVRKAHRAAVGVEWLSNDLAQLWDTAMDASKPDAARALARSKYDLTRNDLLSGKSVQTGQGTITEGDAKRTGGAIPELPTNWLGAVQSAKNYVAAKDPGSTSIRAVGANARSQLDQELAETYGIVRTPKGEGKKASATAPAEPVARKAPIFGKKVGS